MPKIRLTKTELKTQRDALKQFLRFLPTLQLKKQQLQMEMRHCQEKIEANRREEESFRGSLKPWLGLFASAGAAEKLASILAVERVDSTTKNIAGVDVPVYVGVRFKVNPYDLFIEDAWLDDGLNALRKLVELRAERRIIEEQHRRIAAELRTTTQRVNLFEKVKIPECRESIRVIQIYLGDQSTAAVGRSKIAKRKMQEEEAA